MHIMIMIIIYNVIKLCIILFNVTYLCMFVSTYLSSKKLKHFGDVEVMGCVAASPPHPQLGSSTALGTSPRFPGFAQPVSWKTPS